MYEKKIEDEQIVVSHVKSDHQLADMLTKGTSGPKFIRNRNYLMSALFYMLMLFNFTGGIVFEEVAPIVWTRTGHYVNHGQNQYLVELRYTNPCSLLNTLQITERKKRQAQLGSPQTYHNPNGPVGPPQNPSQQSFAYGETMPISQVANHNTYQDFENARAEALGYCNQIYQEYILTPIDSLNRTKLKDLKEKGRTKRSFLETVTSALFYSNIITTIVDKIWNSNSERELQERQHLVEEKVKSLNNEMNNTLLMEKAIGASLTSMAEVVKHTDKRLSIFVNTFPNLVFLTNYITMQIFKKSSLISHIMHGLRFRKIDLVSLSELLETDMYNNIVESSVKLVKVSSPSTGIMRIEFRGRIRDPDTEVIRVDGFRYWANLTGLPTLMEYSGERFLVYNHSSECIRAIDEPSHEYVTVLCDHHHIEDKRLTIWNKVLQTTDPYTQPANTTIKESWPYVYIYCFRLKITINRQTARCPPYVFKLNATFPWNTTDIRFDPGMYELHRDIDASPATHEIHMVHFHAEEHLVDRNLAIDEVIRLNKEKEKMIRESVVLNLPVQGGRISYSAALHLMLIMTGAGFLILIIIIMYRSIDDKRKHHQVMRTVTDGIYGDGTYEVVRRGRKSSCRSTSQMTAPAQVNVTLNGPSTSTSNAPPLPSARGHGGSKSK